VLDDDARRPRIIETGAHKHGYRVHRRRSDCRRPKPRGIPGTIAYHADRPTADEGGIREPLRSVRESVARPSSLEWLQPSEAAA